MDYKTNTLNIQLKCEEILIPEFPTLHYGPISKELSVFDSTRFYTENNLEEIDFKIFQRINKRYIEAIVEHSGIKRGELFYLNKDGHILINQELSFLFVAFAMPDMAAYFNGMIGEIISNGIAYSDRFIVSTIAQRVPTEILREIINERNAADKQRRDSNNSV